MANPNIDYKSWEKRLNKTKPYLAVIDDIFVGFAEYKDDYIDCFMFIMSMKVRELEKLL